MSDDEKAARRFEVFWMTHKEPTKAADMILELDGQIDGLSTLLTTLIDAISTAPLSDEVQPVVDEAILQSDGGASKS